MSAAIDLYARPGVSAACLELQDDHGLDVNCLLACLWAAESGLQILPDPVLREMVEISQRWNRPVVAPLRAARREVSQRIAVENADLQGLKDQIAAVELAAEKIELKALGRLLARLAMAPANGPGIATANLVNYAKSAGAPADGDLHQRLDRLAQLASS